MWIQSRLLGDPFADMRRLQREATRVFSDFQAGPGGGAFPPVNLWAGDDGVAVTAEIPGVDPDGIDISVREDLLTISGERKPPEGAVWRRRERVYGAFSRVVRLPFRVDPDKVEARFRAGLLEVLLQRPDADKPRRIAIKSS